MYKVFLNDREIVITSPGNRGAFQNFETIENMNSVAGVKKWFAKFATTTENNVLIVSANPDEFMNTVFIPAFIKIDAAGGVVKRDEKLLFIFRNGKWDLPKGKSDAGETAEQTAVREVEEECGISGHKIVKKLPSTWHIYQSTWKGSEGEWILKQTHWFEMEYPGTNPGTPETKENITEVRWFSNKELNIVLANTYGNIREIFFALSDQSSIL